ncbi:MAG: TPR end-of-group domain-containing protein [Planctomycetota bacterium]
MNHNAPRHTWPLVATLLLGLAGHRERAEAGGGPETVAVVVNADSRASKTIANTYVHLRKIPSTNVVYLTGLEPLRTTDVETFRERILLPTMKCLYNRGVLPQVDCIAYSADLPTVINVSGDLTSAAREKHQATIASLNGLTYLYQLVLAKQPAYLQPNMNSYRRRPTQSVPPKTLSPEDLAAYRKTLELRKARQWQAACTMLQPLTQKFKSNPAVHYDFACCLARLSRTTEALEALSDAVHAGWSERKHSETDPDLEPLRDSAQFKALLKQMDENRRKPFTVQPTTAFSAEYKWNARGEKVRGRGMRYMLSTVLAITDGGGNSVREVVQALRHSVAADGTHPHGTIYFVKDADRHPPTSQSLFASAVKALKKTGLKGCLVRGAWPEKTGPMAGGIMPAADSNSENCKRSLLPGAICEHLPHLDKTLRNSKGHIPPARFIRQGAAGTCATLSQPHGNPAEPPHPFIHVHYARGCSLAEACYQSAVAPYRLLIVGDPLCQPWANPLQFEVDEPKPGQKVSGELQIAPRILGGPDEVARLGDYELFVDGRRALRNQKGRLLLNTELLGGGWHELRIVAVTNGACETRSHLVLPITVEDEFGGIDLELVDHEADQIIRGDPVIVRATMSLNATIKIACHGHHLGTIEGPRGTLSLDPKQLGTGPVSLQATTQVAGKPIFSPPLELGVESSSPAESGRCRE